MRSLPDTREQSAHLRYPGLRVRQVRLGGPPREEREVRGFLREMSWAGLPIQSLDLGTEQPGQDPGEKQVLEETFR